MEIPQNTGEQEVAYGGHTTGNAYADPERNVSAQQQGENDEKQKRGDYQPENR